MAIELQRESFTVANARIFIDAGIKKSAGANPQFARNASVVQNPVFGSAVVKNPQQTQTLESVQYTTWGRDIMNNAREKSISHLILEMVWCVVTKLENKPK